jgi:hypothetical protein
MFVTVKKKSDRKNATHLKMLRIAMLKKAVTQSDEGHVHAFSDTLLQMIFAPKHFVMRDLKRRVGFVF